MARDGGRARGNPTEAFVSALRLRSKHAWQHAIYSSWGPNSKPACSPLALLAPGTCEELQDAAQATSSDDVVGELTNSGVSCDAWTTFEIAANRLKLVAPEDSSSDDVFVFYNVRFLVASAGTLRVLPRVEFTGDDDEPKVTGEWGGGGRGGGGGAFAAKYSFVVCRPERFRLAWLCISKR